MYRYIIMLTKCIMLNIIVMQLGFACIEAGCVQYKNVTNIMLKNIMDLCEYRIFTFYITNPNMIKHICWYFHFQYYIKNAIIMYIFTNIIKCVFCFHQFILWAILFKLNVYIYILIKTVKHEYNFYGGTIIDYDKKFVHINQLI